MAYTRSWADLINVVKVLAKNVGGLDKIKAEMCDFVSNEMYISYPWKDTITTIAAATLPLVDGQQDYSSPINIYRLTRATIFRTDVTPIQTFELDIADDVPVDLTPKSHMAIRSCSQQQATGTLRLETAVNVPSGISLDLRGEYQLNPIKVVDIAQDMWFKDQYAQVAAQGLIYWAYKLSDDARAGTSQTMNGRMVYTGQLADFMGALERMKQAEDWGASNSLFPEDTFGKGRNQNNAWFLSW